MANYRLVAPVIRWGTNLANAIYFPFPLDNVFSSPDPRDGSETIQGPDGGEDAWTIGTDNVLAGIARWLPPSDTLYFPRATGWDGALGVRGALAALRDKGLFSWHPDGRNLLRKPLTTSGDVTLAGFGGWSTQTDGGLAGASITWDGAQSAWKLTANNPTGGALSMTLDQYVPAIPGEVLCLSLSYLAAMSGGSTGRIEIDAYDTTPTFISQPAVLASLTAGVFTRVSTGNSSALPANTAYARVRCSLQLPAAAAASTIWYKQAVLRRDSTDATFIDNPSVDGCYLVEPYRFSPANESDGSRQLVFKIRNPTTEFAGY